MRRAIQKSEADHRDGDDIKQGPAALERTSSRKTEIALSGEAHLFLNRMRATHARFIDQSRHWSEIKFVFNVTAPIALSIEAIDLARADFTKRARQVIQSR